MELNSISLAQLGRIKLETVDKVVGGRLDCSENAPQGALIVFYTGTVKHSRASTLTRNFREVKFIALDEYFELEVDDSRFLLKQRGVEIELRESSNIYLYMPRSFDELYFFCGSSDISDPQIKTFIQRQWLAVFNGIVELASGSWVNHPRLSEKYSNKLVQYAVFQRMGFSVPCSLFSNVSKLNEKVANGRIIKNLSDTNYISRDNYFSPFIFDKEINELEYDFPVLAQEKVNASSEIRIYVFGDYRVGLDVGFDRKAQFNYKELDQSEVVFNLMQEISSDIVDIINSIQLETKLNLFCLDLLVKPNHEINIIDLNPHGSWYWLQEEIVEYIDKQFVSFLETERSNSVNQF